MTTVAPGMPHLEYLAHPALSASGMKRLATAPPAVFAWEQAHPTEPTPAMELGTAVHSFVFGAPGDVTEVDAASWTTKGAREQRTEARAAGKVALLRGDYATARAMAESVHAHPVARALFTGGEPEVSLFWTDEQTGTPLRARLDYLQHGRRICLADLKTTDSADPTRFAKKAVDYGYHQQAAHYLAGAQECGLIDQPVPFLFVAVEKTPPHLVSVVELDEEALAIGEWLNRRAIDTYAACIESGTWPGYELDPQLVALPRFYTRQYEEL